MPELEVTTTKAKEVWKSPDGQRVIYELVLDYKGKPVAAKTYSKEISEEGWEGTVETYEKMGRGGAETFVKQPQKEQYRGGGYAGAKSSGKDEAAIQAMWAITKGIEWLASEPNKDIADVEALAKDFNAMVDRVKAGETEVEVKETKKKDEPIEGQITLDDINKVFEGEE